MWWSRLGWGLVGLAAACGESTSHRQSARSGGSGGDAGLAGSAGSTASSGAGGAGTSAVGGAAGSRVTTAGSSGTPAGDGGEPGAAGAGEPAVLTELEVSGYDRVEVQAISADGTYVTGKAWSSAGGGVVRGVRWKDAAPTLLETKDGWTGVYPAGISADGSVVAGTVHTQVENHAFVWTGTTVDLLQGLVGLSLGSDAFALSGDGKVVLGRVNDENNQVYGAGWFDGSLTMLPVPSGFELNIALAASFDASVSIGRGENGTADGVVRWLRDDAGNLSAERFSDDYVGLVAVSDDGRWVVGAKGTGSGSVFRGAATGSGIEEITVSATPEAQCEVAATNEDGSIIVGTCVVFDGALAFQGFLWSETHGAVTLDTVLEKLGLDRSVYGSCTIVDISADSSTLLMNCTRSNGDLGTLGFGARLRLAGAFD